MVVETSATVGSFEWVIDGIYGQRESLFACLNFEELLALRGTAVAVAQENLDSDGGVLHYIVDGLPVNYIPGQLHYAVDHPDPTSDGVKQTVLLIPSTEYGFTRDLASLHNESRGFGSSALGLIGMGYVVGQRHRIMQASSTSVPSVTSAS